MSILTCPTRSRHWVCIVFSLLFAACTSTVPPASTTRLPDTPSTANISSFPSVIIPGKSAGSILDAIVKYRTQKGMRLKTRDAKHVEFVMPLPKAKSPTEILMIYSISPAQTGVRLSAQVFQMVRQDSKIQTTEITPGLRDKLEEELAQYAR